MPKTAVTGALLSIDLDRSPSAQPLHHQIVSRLREAIESGAIAPGTKLPSTRTFAMECGISRNTALHVFETLTQEGFLSAQVGSGTFVASPQVRPALDLSGVPERKAECLDRPGYPFRSLSRRGLNLVAAASGEFSERPTSFMPDVPDLREFPIKTWLRLLGETSGRLTGEILTSTANAGYEPLRRALAQYLNASRQTRCDYSRIIITTGSQQGLDLICRLLFSPGDPVWIEEPGYIGTRAIIRANGGVVCPVPVDSDGICVEDAFAAFPSPRLVFTTPSRQYPLGATLSVARREALLDVANRCGAWIVEDDYDHEFRYAGKSPKAMQGMDLNDRTIYMGTFSKVLLPSFRLGYIVVPADLSEAFAKARAVVDRHASLIEQMVLSEFMLRGLFVSHVRRMRGLYRARQSLLAEGLESLVSRPLPIAAKDTGTNLLVPLLNGTDDVAVARHLLQAGVVARPLTPYFATQQRRPGLLFGFAAFNAGEIGDGLRALRTVGANLTSLLA